ncbi:MAG: polysaccharide biosynthesis/export family protein [Lentisphaerae bacterium]|nr:polysaccharide biosynthesis/export family protein [Lentisphaerota bacterium]
MSSATVRVGPRIIAVTILPAALLLMVAAMTAGCLTAAGSHHQAEEYRPRVADRSPWLWAQEKAAETDDPSPPTLADVPVEPNGEPSRRSGSRMIRHGDTLVVGLRGIPKREDVREVVDEDGAVTLPLLGAMKLAGLSTGEAEAAIEKAYVDGGIFRSLDVIVMAEREAYYVRGEVKREGRYSFVSEITLLQALAAAGGYTDYARSTVKVIRDDHTLTFNVRRIERRKEKDPMVEPGDIIVVGKRIIW